jgi:hypothetical protein
MRAEATWVKSVEYVEVTLAGTVMSASTNLSKGQNTADCVPFASMTVTGIDGNFHVGFTDIFFQTGPTRVTAQRGNSAAGTTVTVGVFVVEFDPAHVKVQQGTFAMANNQTGPILSPINPVVLTKTALVFYHIHDGAVPYENFAVTGHFPANNQVAFQRSGDKRPVDGHCAAAVAEHPPASRQHDRGHPGLRGVVERHPRATGHIGLREDRRAADRHPEPGREHEPVDGLERHPDGPGRDRD